jgi:hypothetical protein
MEENGMYALILILSLSKPGGEITTPTVTVIDNVKGLDLCTKMGQSLDSGVLAREFDVDYYCLPRDAEGFK